MKPASKHCFARAMVAALACAAGGAWAADKGPLTVAVYGGIGEKTITECVIKPFTAATGVKVITDPGASALTMTKLNQQKSAPVIDVAWMDGGISELAWKAGLLEPLDPARMPNLENAIPQARYQDDGKIYAASTGYYALGILYNTELVKTPPTSWKDLWKDEYADLVALPSPDNAMGIPLLAHLAKLYGGGLDNPAPAIEQIRKLKVAAFWNSSGTATNMFQNEEIAVSPHFSTSAWTLIKNGQPLKYVAPSDGAVANDIRVHLVHGTPRRELAEQFINGIFTQETASCLARTFYAGPYVKDVKLPPDVAQYMPWGAQGTIDDVVIPDWLALNARREALTDAWNKNIGRR
ncbi:ABC transporter substrate-binding protein [Bordetella genomosp. 6]|uniref:ABC transporter substrate-binding protein n=1 Tax=Bordetella genomosp. 6 TaxID=463024 RepID=UPI0012FC159B|nr:ABC transporter substrate-binding protein [Bordetella genomosp. 6]